VLVTLYLASDNVSALYEYLPYEQTLNTTNLKTLCMHQKHVPSKNMSRLVRGRTNHHDLTYVSNGCLNLFF